jgi:hypothetical protein
VDFFVTVTDYIAAFFYQHGTHFLIQYVSDRNVGAPAMRLSSYLETGWFRGIKFTLKEISSTMPLAPGPLAPGPLLSS